MLDKKNFRVIIENMIQQRLDNFLIQNGFCSKRGAKNFVLKNQVCVNSGKISKKGESIVCLPNKVTVEIE
mgnify:CR=1 FL=1